MRPYKLTDDERRTTMRTLALTITAAITIAIVLIASRPFDVSATPQRSSAVVGDAERGVELFKLGANGAPACTVCHATRTGGFFTQHLTGPNLSGLSERAGQSVAGMSAEDYIHTSIVDPGSHVVEGFADLMFPDFAEKLSEQDIADLVAYLMTL